MKESHRKDLASHPDRESCDGGREATGEALTGAHAGQPSSCEITVSGVPTLSTQVEGNTVGVATDKPPVDPAQSKTFDFLGFTHICNVTPQSGWFLVRPGTARKRLRAKLQAVKRALLAQCHQPIPKQGTWLRRVVRGYGNYHAIPGNMDAVATFRAQSVRHWLHALQRRGQRHRLSWARFARLVARWIPKPNLLHPSPSVQFYAKHPN